MRLVYDLEFCPDLLGRGECLIEILAPQARIHDVSDAGPIFGDHRIDDRQGEDTFIEEAFAESFRGRRIAKHDGGNRRLAPTDVETHRAEPLPAVIRVTPRVL